MMVSSPVAIAAGAGTSVGAALTSAATPATTATATPFGSLIEEAVGQVDSLESEARAAVQGLMTGSGVDVHQAMIATQKATMAFELALAVRNKAVQAYQSVMGMQF
ncbi:MAG: flagellar hook-basal body complex protein FliE [Terracidiphilus sp.]|nr:flagellar hook-basal body complex protein FliE [Terracidiphilus sp.]